MKISKEVMQEFYDAWYWLWSHPIFEGHFQYNLDIELAKVNPENKTVEDDETLNTEVAVWLEIGPYNERYFTHDIDLDCGGETFEEAIIELKKTVLKKYGDYRVTLDHKGRPVGNFLEEHIAESEEDLQGFVKVLIKEGKEFYCTIKSYSEDYKSWVVHVREQERVE